MTGCAIKGDVAITALTHMGIDDVRALGGQQIDTLRAALNRLGLLVDIVTNERTPVAIRPAHQSAVQTENVLLFRRPEAPRGPPA